VEDVTHIPFFLLRWPWGPCITRATVWFSIWLRLSICASRDTGASPVYRLLQLPFRASDLPLLLAHLQLAAGTTLSSLARSFRLALCVLVMSPSETKCSRGCGWAQSEDRRYVVVTCARPPAGERAAPFVSTKLWLEAGAVCGCAACHRSPAPAAARAERAVAPFVST
jgi:hypothetical protein